MKLQIKLSGYKLWTNKIKPKLAHFFNKYNYLSAKLKAYTQGGMMIQHKLNDSIIKNWIKTAQNNTMISDGNNLFVKRYKQSTKFLYKIRTTTNTGTIDSWKTVGEYPLISLSEARKIANEYRSLIEKGINPINFKSICGRFGKTFGEVHEIYINEHVKTLSKNSQKAWRNIMKYTSKLDNVAIEKITEKDIYVIVHKISAKSISHGLVQRIKQMFAWAKQNGYLIKNNLIELSRLYRKNHIDRYLNQNELSSFFAQLFADTEIEPITKITLYSLLICLSRKNELLNLKWCDVNLSSKTIVIPQTKCITNFIIAIPNQLVDLFARLKQQSNQDNQYVFAKKHSFYNEEYLRRDLDKLLRKYKFNRWTPHDLRRTGMTLLSELGERHEIIDSALGHLPKGIRRHYLKANLLQERKELLQKWADFIDKLVDPAWRESIFDK